MSQIKHIINRELKVKLKSRGFYIFVLISPVLFLLPIIIGMFGGTEAVDKNHISIESNLGMIKDTIDYRGLKFFDSSKNDAIINEKLLGVLKIDDDILNNFNSNKRIKLYIDQDDLLVSSDKVKDVQNFINQEILISHSKKLNISDSISQNFTTLKVLQTIVNQNDKEVAKQTAQTLAFVLTMLIYVSFILFNNSILTSVVEEKSNKLAEVLSIFVSPRNLMAGKILGQGISFLIQLVLWIFVFIMYAKLLSWVEITFVTSESTTTASDSYLQATLNSLSNLPLIDLFVYLPLFFIFGFLLNGTFNTILGVYSSRNSSNYLMMIGNIINLIAIYFGIFAAISPNSIITKISYYIPFLNYLTIPSTLAFDLPTSTILTSLFILIGSAGILFYWSIKVYERSIRN